MATDELGALASALVALLIDRNLRIVTAESCTGGLIAGALTEVAGSSRAVFGGFVTYDNQAKIKMIGVPADLLERYGAVSSEVARAMAEGARNVAGVDVAIAVTGIAGPGGGSTTKPVGLVHFACATSDGTSHLERRFGDLGRHRIREEAVKAALELVAASVQGRSGG